MHRFPQRFWRLLPRLFPQGGVEAPAGALQMRPLRLSFFEIIPGRTEGNSIPTVPGRYWVSAERDGYFRQEHFQKGYSGQPESILTLTENQKVEPLTLALTEVPPRTGIIYGADGQRLAAAAVHAYKLEYTPYGRQLSMAASELSHEGGEYRLFHLVPGNYLVSVAIASRQCRPEVRLKLTPNLPVR
jgi:hypothetical protein